MTIARERDIKTLLDLPSAKLIDLFFSNIRNVWRVDGLYFLGIEQRFGTEVASAIDGEVHQALARIEATELPRLLGLEALGIPDLMKALSLTCWALDQRDKEVEIGPERALIRVAACATQSVRQKKGLGVFPCKPVRLGYLEAFVEVFNPELQVKCRFCPPDERPAGAWCEWEFIRRSKP